MKEIRKQNFPHERDLYAANGIHLIDCSFDGAEDGESALKEGRNLILEHCYMNLRYPLWHDKAVTLREVTMTERCRAALWYTEKLNVSRSRLLGIKALRECRDVVIDDTEIVSPEFGWKSHRVALNRTSVKSEYFFFQASEIALKQVAFSGKYSFQYVENVTIADSVLDTKDAFWHSKNVTVKNSLIKGEYLAWYAENLTLIHCKIIGTQPLCYCKGLKLIDCEMEATDFSFEYSDVEAEIAGDILSVKNPRSGRIVADRISEVILTDDSVYPCRCEIATREK